MSGSDNASSADNQQERLLTSEWIVGFVDGEGCFSVPIVRSSSMKLGWQVQPAFAVVQGASSRDVLEDLVQYFGCGSVISIAGTTTIGRISSGTASQSSMT